MEYNKEEARKAMGIAERKLSKKDYIGAKKFVIKAQNLYPKLDGLEQVFMMIDVFISASNKTSGGEDDWYGILGVDPLADDETVKKQYRKLALLLHPDKNNFEGAEGAFKLVLEAWCLLCDKDKRSAYDHKRKSKEEAEKPPKQRRKKTQRKGSGTFWTMCNKCNTQCEYLRDNYLNKAVNCPNCRQTFIATEKFLQGNVVKLQSSTPSSRNKNTNLASSPSTSETQKTPQASGGTYSERTYPSTYVGFSYKFQWNCSVSAKTSSNAGNQAQETVKRWFEEPQGNLATAERMLKKQRTDVR